MKTCSTCRFMAEPRGLEHIGETYQDDEQSEHRTCVRIIHGNGGAKYEDWPGVKAAPALVVDGSGYAARLIVLPTFGCTLHEPKDDARPAKPETPGGGEPMNDPMNDPCSTRAEGK